MDLLGLLSRFENCQCGEKHTVDIKDIIIEHGVKDRIGAIIKQYTDLKRIYLVSDNNALNAASGVLSSLENEGFEVEKCIYENIVVADMRDVDKVASASKEYDIILSVGSGSCNDICRLASFKADKLFILFATAPSMDGLASDTAPITYNNFKMSYQARQPFLILADTEVLAKAPKRLKGAGFGDMMAKYIGLCDWHISNILTGEKICPRVEELTWTAAERIRELAQRITADDEESAKAVAEALILTGIAMKFAHSSRPASGAEHVISHFWEIKKLEDGKISDLHGRKVAVATLICSRIYHLLASLETIHAKKDSTDWDKVRRAYGENLYPSVAEMNTPLSITDGVTPDKLEASWSEIRGFVERFIPKPYEMERLLTVAGAPTTLEEIEVTRDLGILGIIYHSYMRRRMTLMRILPMIEEATEEAVISAASI